MFGTNLGKIRSVDWSFLNARSKMKHKTAFLNDFIPYYKNLLSALSWRLEVVHKIEGTSKAFSETNLIQIVGADLVINLNRFF